MTTLHPGGEALTERLFSLCKMNSFKGARLLDMGCGEGASRAAAGSRGADWTGIDISPSAPDALKADMRELPFDRATFDIVLAECSVLISGDVGKSLGEAFRVLRSGGYLLLSDVFFCGENAPELSAGMPANINNWLRALSFAGFADMEYVDETPLWREFYIRAVWEGREVVPECFAVKKGSKPGYFIMSCKKP